MTAEEFANIVVRANPDGSVLRVSDVARIELGAAAKLRPLGAGRCDRRGSRRRRRHRHLSRGRNGRGAGGRLRWGRWGRLRPLQPQEPGLEFADPGLLRLQPGGHLGRQVGFRRHGAGDEARPAGEHERGQAYGLPEHPSLY